MRPLGPTECISPAIARTKDFLARPFRLGTYLKLAAVAFFAEVGGGSCNFTSPGGNHSRTTSQAFPHQVPGFASVGVLLAIAIIAIIIGLILFYVGTRLQLVLVEMVAARQQYVSPFWRKQGPATWSWLGLKLLFFFAMMAVMLVLTLPLIFYFVHHRWGSGSFGGHWVAIVLIVTASLVALLLLGLAYMLLRNFAAPPIALEDVSLSEAFRRARAIFELEPGAVTGFLLLQLVLMIAFAIAAEILLLIVILLSLIPFGIVGGLAWFALHQAGKAGMVVLISLLVILGTVFLAWTLCLSIALLGPVYVFNQAYALYFLGGRYPLLGSLLDQSEPHPFELLNLSPPAPPIIPPNPA